MEKYICENSLREPAVLKELREIAKCPVYPLQEQLCRMLMKLNGSKKCLVAGKQIGYGALSCAMATPDGSEVFAIDFNQEVFDETYKPSLEKANCQDKVHVKIGNPLEVMDDLIKDNHNETFDFVHISNGAPLEYENYVERAHLLVKIGGLIAVDNVLQDGRVVAGLGDLSPEQRSAAQFFDKFNKKLHKDNRFDVSLLNVESGLTLLRRVEPK